MISNFFTNYTSREEMIVDLYISDNDWLKEFIKEVRKENTSFHDLVIELIDGSMFTVEIKEDEYYWYSRTGNIGLDYYSAFNFKNNKRKWLSYNGNWIKKQDLDAFKEDIIILKEGKLFTCDADFQLFVVVNNGELIFSQLYSNKLLQSNDFIHHLESNYDLRINKKSDYGIEENWESAAYFVKPSDLFLVSAEVRNLPDFINNKLKV